SSSSAPSGPGRRCCRERVLARLLLRCWSDGLRQKPEKQGFESGGSSRKGVKSPFERHRLRLAFGHYAIWEAVLAVASFPLGQHRVMCPCLRPGRASPLP